jgi:hypothetical protein
MNPEFCWGKPALEMWFKAMEEVSKCKKELDEFMTMENKSAEEDSKVIELSGVGGSVIGAYVEEAKAC